MKLRICIDTSNAAFDGDARDDELVRILWDIAGRIRDGALVGGYRGHENIRDSNGNTVGTFTFKCDTCDRSGRLCGHDE